MPSSSSPSPTPGSPLRGHAITIAGVPLLVASDAACAPAVKTQLAPWSPRGGEPDDADLRVTLDSAPDTFALRDRTSLCLRVRDEAAMRVALQDWIDATIAARASRLLPVHAGVVALNQQAWLLPATSGAGKTTLVAALVARGACYYSDELALIDDDGLVHAYPRHPVVRDVSGERRPAINTSIGALPPPVRVSAILDLRYDARDGFDLGPLESSEAVMVLLTHTVRPLSAAAGLPIALINAARSARSYRGVRSDADAAAAALIRQLESEPR